MTATVPAQRSILPSGEITAAFRREAPGLLGFFLRRGVDAPDAADLVSETFLAAWKNHGRSAVEPELLRAWLFGIARKVLSQHRRGRIRRSALAERVRITLAAEPTARADGSPSDSDSELTEHVRELIGNLPDLDQEIVRLVYWDGFSQEEVAVILGKPATAIRSRLSRARSALREQLAESGDVS